jgi:hypothetical protein
MRPVQRFKRLKQQKTPTFTPKKGVGHNALFFAKPAPVAGFNIL